MGRKEKGEAKSNGSGRETKVEELKNNENAGGNETSSNSSKKAGKNPKRTASSEHPKQKCILKGHTSDVLHIEFTANGKLLGSTSLGRFIYFMILARWHAKMNIP